jgi:ribonuclease inhibitor
MLYPFRTYFLKILAACDIHLQHRFIIKINDLGFFFLLWKNLDVPWGRLTTDIERPIKITWYRSELSKKSWRAI